MSNFDKHFKTKISIFLFFLSVSIFPQTKTFIQDYSYASSKVDSKNISCAIALHQVRTLLLTDVETFLEKEDNLSKFGIPDSLSQDFDKSIKCIISWVTDINILESRWIGTEYFIKASLTITQATLGKRISIFLEQKNSLSEFEEDYLKTEEAFLGINGLQERFATSTAEKEKSSIRRQYITLTNLITASDYLHKSYSKFLDNEFDKSILYCKKAIEYGSNSALTYNIIGLENYFKGNNDEAINFYEKAIKLNPMSALVYSNMGLVFIKKANFDKAISCFGKAISLDSNFAVAYDNMGLGNYYKGNNNEAIDLYEKAIKLNPKSALAYSNMGLVYFRKAKFDTAISCFEKAIELNPKLAVAYYNLGYTYLDRYNFKMAIPPFEKAANLGYVGAREWIKKIKALDKLLK